MKKEPGAPQEPKLRVVRSDEAGPTPEAKAPPESVGDEEKPRLGASLRQKLGEVKDQAGLLINELPPQTLLLVRTQNSVYKILIVDPSSGDIIIEGGRKFTKPQSARLNGTTLGGSTIMMGWIKRGGFLEIGGEGLKTWTTSMVDSIIIDNNSQEVERLNAAVERGN
jgi:hypothetical protein